MFTLEEYATGVLVGIWLGVMICNIIVEIDNRKR